MQNGTPRICFTLMPPLFRPFLFVLMTTSLCAQSRVDHVIVVSIDGAKPSVVHESEAPTLKKLAAEGAVTWEASTIFPSKTLPSHTSMICGVGPDKHQVLWNNYMPIRGMVKSPTMFTILRQSEPTAVTALFAGKAKFRHLWQKDSLDLFDFGGPQTAVAPAAPSAEIEKDKKPSQLVAKQAAEWLKTHKPRLAFIHFPDVDSAGHASGWGSPEQKEAMKVTDQALYQIRRAIEDNGMAANTVLIVSADHGGHLKTHGENIPDDMLIPWVAWGKGVKKNHPLTTKITTFDTAATALWLLGIPVPADWDGKPVTEAFESN